MTGTPLVTVRTDELAVVLRTAHVTGERLHLRARPGHPPRAGAPPPGGATLRVRPSGSAACVLDVHNGIALLDAGTGLAEAGRLLLRAGAVLPIARPLPPCSIAVACAAVPFIVDALVQHARGLTLAGDPWESPRGPRAAAGPSLPAALSARPPLAVATSVALRVALAGQVEVKRVACADVQQAARRVCALLDEGRAIAVDALGSVVLVLEPRAAGASGPAEPPGAFAHRAAGRRASFATSTSLVPGDARAIADALASGARVVGAPSMGRVAALTRAGEPLPLLDVEAAAASLAHALTNGAHGGAR